MSEHCGRLKDIADKLRVIGSPLTDQDLVINLLSGINDKFANCIPTISRVLAAHDVLSGALLPPSRRDLGHKLRTTGDVHRTPRRVLIRWVVFHFSFRRRRFFPSTSNLQPHKWRHRSATQAQEAVLSYWLLLY